MALDVQYISLDISKRPTPQQVRLGQGDANGTQLVVSIFDNGTAYSLANKSVRLALRLPGNDAYYEVSGTASNNTATFNIDETYAASSHGSDGFGYVDVMNGDTVICSTSRFQLVVLRSAEDGADPSAAYSNGIIEATNAANAAAASATSAAGSATTAAANADAKAGLANTAATAANSAASTATAAASTASSNAAAAASAASQANSAATAANSAAEAANDATEDTEAATAAALAAIEAMGDISELAVPEMSANIRGGAKLGVGLGVSDGRLNVDLSDSGSGASVLTNGCALLDVEGDGWAEQDGTPTPENPQEVRVAKGRNLLDESVFSNASTTSKTTQLILLPNTTYILSSNLPKTSINTANFFVYPTGGSASTNTNGVWENNPRTVTTGSDGIVIIQYRTADYPDTSAAWFMSHWFQLELGSTATPYVPYGCIGLQIGDTVTPIDLQGNVLASLPDGTHDTLSIDSAGHVVAGKRISQHTFDGSENWGTHASIASWFYVDGLVPGMDYAKGVSGAAGLSETHSCVAYTNVGNLVDNQFAFGIVATSGTKRFVIKETAVTTAADFKTWLASNNFTFMYPLTTPQTIDLGYIDLPLIPDGCTVSIPELHEIDVEWVVTCAEAIPDMVADVRKWALHEIALAGDAELSTIAAVENATASTNYAVGSYLVHGGVLYRVTTAIATGETINPGTNCTATTVMAEIIRLTA